VSRCARFITRRDIRVTPPDGEAVVEGPVTWKADAAQSSAGHPGFHIAPEATLFYRLTHAGVKIAAEHQQDSRHEKDRRQQNGKSDFHAANMPCISGIFQPGSLPQS